MYVCVVSLRRLWTRYSCESGPRRLARRIGFEELVSPHARRLEFERLVHWQMSTLDSPHLLLGFDYLVVEFGPDYFV